MWTINPSRNDYLGSMTVECCYNWGTACCRACNHDLEAQCRAAFPQQYTNAAMYRYCKGFVFGGQFSCPTELHRGGLTDESRPRLLGDVRGEVPRCFASPFSPRIVCATNAGCDKA